MAVEELVEIYFVRRAGDEYFSEEGARAFFDLLGSQDKIFEILRGLHEETLDQLDLAARFPAD